MTQPSPSGSGESSPITTSQFTSSGGATWFSSFSTRFCRVIGFSSDCDVPDYQVANLDQLARWAWATQKVTHPVATDNHMAYDGIILIVRETCL
jgi:hypothetical protein